MENYKLTNSSTILRLSDNAHIPDDQANLDYMQYLVWIAEGNTPLPIDPPTVEQQVAEVKSETQRIILAKWPLWAQQNCNDGTYSPVDKEQMLAYKALVLTECTRLVADLEAGQPITPNWPTI